MEISKEQFGELMDSLKGFINSYGKNSVETSIRFIICKKVIKYIERYAKVLKNKRELYIAVKGLINGMEYAFLLSKGEMRAYEVMNKISRYIEKIEREMIDNA